MNLSEYTALDGLGLAGLITKGDVSAAEVAAAALAAINAVNDDVGAVIETWEARAGDDHIAYLPDGPLRGVPFLIKDLMVHEAGLKSESGSRLAEGMVAPHDTHLMQRYKAAGLNTLGRTKTPEMGYNLSTENVLHGPVRNPWNTKHSAGGSSGGAAAAVASGMVPVAHANDGGGSIRIPAAACGLFGLKPTRMRTPIGPDFGVALNGFGVENVVSRTVRDSAAFLDATEGPMPGDAYVQPRPVRPYLDAVASRPESLRVAVMTEGWNAGAIDPDVVRTVRRAAEVMGGLGHTVDAAAPALGLDWDSFIETNAVIWSAFIATAVDITATLSGRKPGPDTLEATTLACYEYGSRISAKQYIGADLACNMVSRSVAAFFEDHDILISPVLARPPARLGVHDANAPGVDALEWTRQIFEAAPFTPVFNMTGQPAMSMPLGQSADGLPIGVQFAAAYGNEDILFALAAQIEDAMPWADRRPPVFAGR